QLLSQDDTQTVTLLCISPIALLRRWLKSLGDTQDTAEVFTALQAFRSAGGVAHLGGSKAGAARARLGIDGMLPIEAFAHVTVTLTKALIHVADLVEEYSATSDVKST